jgi:3-hydroxyacyl-CoA dehydrogenase
MIEAEKLYREGTSVEAIDKAMRESIFPMDPFELGDQAGLDIAAGMFDNIAAAEKLPFQPLAWKLREQKRFGIKTGAGIYDYKDGKKGGLWSGLAGLVPDRGIVGSEEECDLAFIFGIGFAMHLGGPIFYGKQRGW